VPRGECMASSLALAYTLCCVCVTVCPSRLPCLVGPTRLRPVPVPVHAGAAASAAGGPHLRSPVLASLRLRAGVCGVVSPV
jgi:hypothetical protein